MYFKIFNSFIDNFRSYYWYLCDYIDLFIKIFGLYFVWILFHYIASHLYVHWCVPATIVGFLMSPFLVPAPHCQALRWIIYNGANNINAMWLFLSTWLISRVIPLKNHFNKE